MNRAGSSIVRTIPDNIGGRMQVRILPRPYAGIAEWYQGQAASYNSCYVGSNPTLCIDRTSFRCSNLDR